MDFLVRRPIAVIMAFLAFVLIGLVTYNQLPVSLLPDIAIPQITVQVQAADKSARELENTVVSNIRQQLLQVGGLDEIHSTTRDGIGVINMRFKFGTNTDYAYIEVNEKIDASMNNVPSGIRRPKAIKASASDIPVFYLNIALKDGDGDGQRYLEMCDAVENNIRRRIEQLPEVAMADATGIPRQCIKIYPDYSKMSFLGLQVSDIENAISANNIEAGSMRVKDGVYEYTIRVSTLLTNQSDVENIYLNLGDRHIQLKDICTIRMESQQDQGYSLANGRRVVTLAVIKQADEGMDQMRSRIHELVEQFQTQFPNLSFEICRNQTELLDYTISNLKQNLILGFVLMLIVAVLFMGGLRSSIVIAISMAAAVVITFVPFFVAGRSLNIVSLSGLILVVGMMIDNALIVSENISQWQQRGYSLRASCVGATREMIAPLLSSTLTTVAVFVPLVFIKGMAGSLFSDQAFAITAGLGVAYVVGIMLLPVIYRVVMARCIRKGVPASASNMGFISRGYNRMFGFVMSHRTAVLAIAVASLPLCWIMFSIIPKSKMPQIDYQELTARIEWNQEISVQENRSRVESLMADAAHLCQYHTAYVGMQDYIVEQGNELSTTEASLYWKTESPSGIEPLRQKVQEYMDLNFPGASISFAPPMTVFEKLFETSEADIEARLSYSGPEISADDTRNYLQNIRSLDTSAHSTMPAFKNVRMLMVNREAMMLYNVPLQALRARLTSVIAGSRISELHSYSSYIPVFLSESDTPVEQFINTGSIRVSDRNNQTSYIPIRKLVSIVSGKELKSIVAGKTGQYIPICFYNVSDAAALAQRIQAKVDSDRSWDVELAGSFFSNKEMLIQLIVILLISLALMYFILCGQFESFSQPLIVLLEIPIDASFALLVLWLSGMSLNLMSGIGIIVSCGIIVNDSILKIDTINGLRKSGMPLLEAVHKAGERRLRAIVMTSLTTIGATLPILFTNDMGSEIQQPLAVAMIATMTIGTLVSLYVIPLIYVLIAKSQLRNPNS